MLSEPKVLDGLAMGSVGCCGFVKGQLLSLHLNLALAKLEIQSAATLIEKGNSSEDMLN